MHCCGCEEAGGEARGGPGLGSVRSGRFIEGLGSAGGCRLLEWLSALGEGGQSRVAAIWKRLLGDGGAVLRSV